MAGIMLEPPRRTAIAGTWDVVVIGGGIAGVSAALAAARRGLKVVVVEKECNLGGLATLGNVVVYLPLCDGRGRQVMSGIAEELLRLSIRDVRGKYKTAGLNPVPACWTSDAPRQERIKQRFRCTYNAASFQLEMEALLVREGIDIWYDSRLCGCQKEGKRISHVMVENKSGRLAIGGRMFIDASGDADLCALADCATDDVDGNVVCGWHYLLRNGSLYQQGFSHRFFVGFEKKGDGPFFSGIKGSDVSSQVIQTHAGIRARIEELRAEAPEDEVYAFQIPSIPSFRATRRLDGAFLLEEAHMHQWFDDTIGITGDWRIPGQVWAVPLRALRSDRCVNLFAAGRCISAERLVWDVTRVIPTCALTGEAAGAAAGVALRTAEGDSSKISVPMLQRDLAERGVLLDPDLLHPLADIPPPEAGAVN